MKKVKNMLRTIVKQPFSRLGSGSSQARKRYHDLLQSIRKLARPTIPESKQGKDQ